MRLFVALAVPDRVREAVEAAVAPHRQDDRVSWTRSSGWHVTLAFVGEVTTDDEVDGGPVEVVRAATAAGCRAAGTAGPIEVRTGRAVTLGRGALAVEVADDPDRAVERLGAAIQAALEGAGLPIHARRVRPHLTLARARRRRSIPAALVDAIDVPEVGWTVDGVEVVESVLGQGPATYVTRASVPLRAGETPRRVC